MRRRAACSSLAAATTTAAGAITARWRSWDQADVPREAKSARHSRSPNLRWRPTTVWGAAVAGRTLRGNARLQRPRCRRCRRWESACTLHITRRAYTARSVRAAHGAVSLDQLAGLIVEVVKVVPAVARRLRGERAGKLFALGARRRARRVALFACFALLVALGRLLLLPLQRRRLKLARGRGLALTLRRGLPLRSLRDAGRTCLLDTSPIPRG